MKEEKQKETSVYSCAGCGVKQVRVPFTHKDDLCDNCYNNRVKYVTDELQATAKKK